MNFWDSSAIIPLLVQQPLSERSEKNYRSERRGICVWWGTISECVSALSRLEREGSLNTIEVEVALRAMSKFAATWHEILPSDLVRERANRLLRVHPLRTGDAYQLASAIIASEDRASQISLATYDERLATAARKEGFEIID